LTIGNIYVIINAVNNEVAMKRCPRCMKYDREDIRFCKHCNTELFFVERFEELPPKESGFFKKLFSAKRKKQ
jgi:hypothetical protein